ncbi:MAG: hypothetical protein ACI8WM_002967 [Burkholderiaceae bacterium]|jgi:hypothetical protein
MGIRPIDTLIDRQVGKTMSSLNRQSLQVIGQYFSRDILIVLQQAYATNSLRGGFFSYLHLTPIDHVSAIDDR